MVTKLSKYNLKHNNTFGLNALADEWIEYTSADDLPAIFASLGDSNYFCIGEGSNLLFTKDFNGALLHSRILDMELDANDAGYRLRIGSGVKLDDVVEQLAASGIWGLENLSYIPGYAGSAAVQNVGAYGVEIKDFVVEVECFDTLTSRFAKLSKDECQFGYRKSIFKLPEYKKRYVVTYLVLFIPRTAGPQLGYGGLAKILGNIPNITPMQVREAIIELRRSKLPETYLVGSAGSFFMNPVVDRDTFLKIRQQSEGEVPHYDTPGGGVKIPAAWLIDQCGLKGYRHNSAAVWEKQPLVIVNSDGNATAEDILAVENKIITDVETRFGIKLHPEVDHL